MSLSPLTPKAVEDKLEELYSLTDFALLEQAQAMKSDFRAWLKSNFQLTTEQISYLDGTSDDAITYYAEQSALCFVQRLPIKLIYPDPPTTPSYAKWKGATNDIVVTSDGNGQVKVTGSLTFRVKYR